jgi:hypothetical protein
VCIQGPGHERPYEAYFVPTPGVKPLDATFTLILVHCILF